MTSTDAMDAEYPFSSTEERRALIAVGVVFTFLGLITMILRLLTITIRHRSVGNDDWAMTVAWVCSIGFAICSFVSVGWGVGFAAAPAQWEMNALKAVYGIEIFYYFSIFFIKISIMCLYLRLAAHTDSILRKGTLAMSLIVTAQFISTLVVVGTQCIPLSKYWDRSVSGRCISITGFFYSTNIFTIITDCVMLALPVPILWRLQRPKMNRIGILSAFLMGGLLTISSIVRLYSVRIYTESDMPLRDAAPINTWSFIEVNLGILCTSLVAIKPLFLPPKPTGGSQYFSDSADRSESLELSKIVSDKPSKLPQMQLASDKVRSTTSPDHSEPKERSRSIGSQRPDSSCLTPQNARYEVWANRHIKREESFESLDSRQILVKKAFTVRCTGDFDSNAP